MRSEGFDLKKKTKQKNTNKQVSEIVLGLYGGSKESRPLM
jgi:hypothetical protein